MAKTKQQKRLKRVNKKHNNILSLQSKIQDKILYLRLKASLEERFPDKEDRLTYIKKMIEEMDKEITNES